MAYTDMIKIAEAAGEIESAQMRQPRRGGSLFKLPFIDQRFVKYLLVNYAVGSLAIAILFALVALYDMLFLGSDASVATRNVLSLGDRFWFILAACMALQMAISLSFISRFSGTIVPFRRTIKALSEGEIPSTIKQREDDFLGEEALLLNRAIVRLQIVNRQDHEQIKALVRLREDLRADGQELHAQSIDFVLEDLNHRCNTGAETSANLTAQEPSLCSPSA